MTPPCCSNLHQEDVESKSKVTVKFQGKQPKYDVNFKILIHYSTYYLRAIAFISP